jgi:dTDP-4-dehydrorhamnose 3,5-epimerase
MLRSKAPDRLTAGVLGCNHDNGFTASYFRRVNDMAVKLFSVRRFADARGWFSEVYNARAFGSRGVDVSFVQDNQSFSGSQGTIRGLHFQSPPHAQAKLVRCLRGALFDVAVDVRRGSPTYGQWVGAELSAQNGKQLFIPVGFAHGFMTLEPDTEVFYKVTDFYAPDSDGGLRWNDSSIGVEWPIKSGAGPLLSDKDEKLPFLAEFESPFTYDGIPLSLIEV